MIIIAGPCVIESYDILEEVCERLISNLPENSTFYFKSSYRKANRTNIQHYMGIGPEAGIDLLLKIKRQFNVKICTDFHSVEEIEEFGNLVDMVQIPAYLGQQTPMMYAAANTGKKIHLKKPQFLSPISMKDPIDKLKGLRVKSIDIIVSDRGTMFGYDQLMMDPRHYKILKENDISVLADITHPNKNYIRHDNQNAEILAKSAIVSGADGLFLETHPEPIKAMCDKQTQLPIITAIKIINKCYNLWGNGFGKYE
jgi:2-dehydro-3-deoxyphosphooctonate aldolase (KDO 8-P synthase)